MTDPVTDPLFGTDEIRRQAEFFASNSDPISRTAYMVKANVRAAWSTARRSVCRDPLRPTRAEVRALWEAERKEVRDLIPSATAELFQKVVQRGLSVERGEPQDREGLFDLLLCLSGGVVLLLVGAPSGMPLAFGVAERGVCRWTLDDQEDGTVTLREHPEFELAGNAKSELN